MPSGFIQVTRFAGLIPNKSEIRLFSLTAHLAASAKSNSDSFIDAIPVSETPKSASFSVCFFHCGRK